MLVGAGGHACPVARRLRGDEPVPVIRAQEAEFPVGAEEAGAVVGGVPVPWEYLGWAALYAALYSAVAILVALVLFQHRDLA